MASTFFKFVFCFVGYGLDLVEGWICGFVVVVCLRISVDCYGWRIVVIGGGCDSRWIFFFLIKKKTFFLKLFVSENILRWKIFYNEINRA